MGELGWLVSTRVAADIAALIFVKGTLLLLIVVVVGHWVRRRSAAFRHRAWVLGLVGLVSLPIANRVLPTWGDVGLAYPAETTLLGMEALETHALTRDAEGSPYGHPCRRWPTACLRSRRLPRPCSESDWESIESTRPARPWPPESGDCNPR